MKHRIWRYLLAILLGNLIFFGLESRLPIWLRHEPYVIDLGLAVDLAICVGVYFLIRLIR
jgi:hypothetical protein